MPLKVIIIHIAHHANIFSKDTYKTHTLAMTSTTFKTSSFKTDIQQIAFPFCIDNDLLNQYKCVAQSQYNTIKALISVLESNTKAIL